MSAIGSEKVPCRQCRGRGCTSPVPSEFNQVCGRCHGSGDVLSLFVEWDLTLGSPEEFELAFELPSDFMPAHIHMNVAWPGLIIVHGTPPPQGATDGHVFYPYTLNPETSEYCGIPELLQRRPMVLPCSYSGWVPSGFAPGTNFRFQTSIEGKS